MKKKIASALVSLMMVLLASFVCLVPLGSAAVKENSRYWAMGGRTTSHAQLGNRSVVTTVSVGSPMSSCMNITFSDAWYYNATYGWIVNITIPYTSYVPGPYSYEWDSTIGWIRVRSTYPVDGHGWIFLNGSMGDVDCYVANNITGAYWKSPSPKAGTLAAAPGKWPDPGPDGVGGTGDDGFGDSAKDPKGSSIMYIVSTARTEAWTGSTWIEMFKYNWTTVWTTGTAYDIVTYPGNLLNGYNSTEVGQPWEFLRGADPQHLGDPDYASVPYDNPLWNAYVTYASSWSAFNITTTFGKLNLLVEETQKHVKEYWVAAPPTGLPPGYYVLPDINIASDSDETVDIFDVVICAAAFGGKDVMFPDRKPPQYPDPNWDPRGDLKDVRGEVDIFDFVVIATWFGSKLNRYGIILP